MRLSQLALPLTRLICKEVPFSWNSECEQSFCKLKEKLTTAPIQIILDPTQKYEVFCYTSEKWLGCVLMHNGQMVAYASHKLKHHEENYLTRDIE